MSDKPIPNNTFNLKEQIESKNKSFDDRNDEKKQIHHNGILKGVKIGQIWICKIGMNIGNEVSKGHDHYFQRPVLVVSTFIGGDLVGVIPCSTQSAKSKYMEQFTLPFNEWEKYGLDKQTNFLINQFKIISIKRLVNDITTNNANIPLLPKENVTSLLELVSEKILKLRKN